MLSILITSFESLVILLVISDFKDAEIDTSSPDESKLFGAPIVVKILSASNFLRLHW